MMAHAPIRVVPMLLHVITMPLPVAMMDHVRQQAAQTQQPATTMVMRFATMEVAHSPDVMM
jgi:hypothetical protein